MGKVILSKEHGKDVADMRTAYCEEMVGMAEQDDRIVALDADLMAAMGMKPFAEKFPERTIDCGVQEANMIGVACGLSVWGKIPFAHTFGPFCTRRACDQIFMSGAYNRANVKVVGSDPGITASYNGGTHMPFEDMGIMRGIPTMTVIEPTDIVMLKNLMPQIAEQYGMMYMRLVRKDVRKVYADGSTFEIGKAAKLTDGSDVTIIASGFCVAESLDAVETLKEEGISVRLLNMFTWKPLDKEAVLAAAEETGAIVTAENHNVVNGLGSAVSELLAKENPTIVEMVGVQDEFGEVGPVDYLRERFGLTKDNIVEAVHKALERKAEGGK
ncbi:MAG: transketolase C-terminal domain-containing protein [Bacillota bacterium]|nr:transketolase C-terminal domain-containing protein [Bacillota bacterium]